MTRDQARGRVAFVTVAMAIAIAAVGVLVRPILPARSQGAPAGRHIRPGQFVVPTTLVRLAEQTAATSLSCRSRGRPRRQDCGRLRVTDTEANQTDENHITVRVLGELEGKALPTPIAMRVELTAIGAGWTATVMAP
jgi:hypothetical protein